MWERIQKTNINSQLKILFKQHWTKSMNEYARKSMKSMLELMNENNTQAYVQDLNHKLQLQD